MELFSLRWNNYLNEVTDAFYSLRNDEDLVDVTISCEGRKLKAHKVLLSACSSYFRDIFKDNPCQHPVIVFRNVKFDDIEAIVDYIYRGEVSVEQSQLESFLGTAQLLEVKGLSREQDVTNEEDNVLRDAETIEAFACAQPVETCVPIRPPLKKRKTSRQPDIEELPSTERTFVNVKLEPCEEYVTDEPLNTNTANIKTELLAVLKNSTSDSSSSQQNLMETDQIKEAADSSDDGTSGEDRAIMSMQAETINNEGEENEQFVIKSDPEVKLSKEKSGKVPPVNLTTSSKPPSLTNSAKLMTQETPDYFVASKRIKVDVESNRQNQEKSDVKPSVMKGNVHIPKGLTVTVYPVELGDSHNAQPTEEGCVLRSENAKTPVGEEICSFQIQQQETVPGFTDTDQIQQGASEMAEEAPLLKSEQETADIPEEEEPEFDYYGCEICKIESKAYDRLSFTHKCPICPCMCFCSHLLKEHMRVIHGWFNVQRKFTKNYQCK